MSIDESHEYSATLAADGTFTLADVAPGKYVVEVKGPEPWNLSSAIANGLDALDSFLEVPRDRDVRDLTLTFRDRPTELSGAVLDPSTEPVDGRTVIVFPVDERLWTAGTHRIRATDVSENGRYEFTNLRPGTYRLAVVMGAEPDEWLHPEFLRQLADAAIPITIALGDKKTQDLRVR